jgi:hypothetical protein
MLMSYIKRKVLFSRGRPPVCAHVGTLDSTCVWNCQHLHTCRTAQSAAKHKNKHQACSELVGGFVSVRGCRFVGLGPVNFSSFLVHCRGMHIRLQV